MGRWKDPDFFKNSSNKNNFIFIQKKLIMFIQLGHFIFFTHFAVRTKKHSIFLKSMQDIFYENI